LSQDLRGKGSSLGNIFGFYMMNKDTCCDDSVVTSGDIVVIRPTAYNVNVYFFS